MTETELYALLDERGIPYEVFHHEAVMTVAEADELVPNVGLPTKNLFLRDDSLREFRPGRTYGFLEKPYAIDRSVALKTIDLRESAGRIDLSRHIPASIDVGGTRIGPGDFLVAALKALNGGPAPSKCPESVTISPSDPLADLDQFPRLRDFHPAGTWAFWPEYKDEFTSDRLRWQLWTWRRE